MVTQNQTVLIDINAVKRQTGFRSTQTIYTKMNEEGFPRPISVGARTKRWIMAEVEAWIQDKIESSRAA
ncbi:MAG: helix-turn-helix transcriptional regulator [Castellaniella sp.]